MPAILTSLLMGQDVFLMLLEADKVEVQIFDTILFKQVLSNQAAQVDASLGEGVILIQR